MYNNKNKPVPIEKIAVALAFSPRLKGVLSNALRFAYKIGAELLLIHVGNETSAKKGVLDQLLKDTNTENVKFKIFWERGDPVNGILKVCKENQVDLLLAGALVKESVMTYYLGSVARKISRRAKCSTLMLTNPTEDLNSLEKIVVGVTDSPKTQLTIETAIYFGQKFNAKKLMLVKESNLFDYARMLTDDRSETESDSFKMNFLKDESESIKKILAKCDTGNLDCKIEILSGKPGFELAQFAKNQKADLLVVNSPDIKLGFIDRVFPHDLEHVLMNLPCSLLIVHSKIS